MELVEKQKILAVDDTPEDLDVVKGVLQEDYTILLAVKGQLALKIAEAQKPDLILLDIMMPEMDGYEVCRRLKENAATREIPVIFITVKSEVDDEVKGFELGAIDYISKPISPPIVKARIRNHLKLKKQHDQLKKSISIMQHKEEILQQKADLGIQAGGLAHDINNILAGSMIVQMIPYVLPDEYQQKEKVERYVQDAMKCLRLGVEVCQGYTSYLRDIGGEARAQPVIGLLQPLEMYSREFRGRLIRKFAEDLPQILCKGYQIKRVFVNLFTNAKQAIEDQDEQIIAVRAWAEDGRVFILMHDNGPGIPSDILPNIFKERFTTKDNGTGLGLFMVKEIVESHHGTIEIATGQGEGTVFTLSFPAV